MVIEYVAAATAAAVSLVIIAMLYLRCKRKRAGYFVRLSVLIFRAELAFFFFFLRALGGAAATECVGFVPVSTTHSFNGTTCQRPPHLLQHNTHENY